MDLKKYFSVRTISLL